MNIDQKTQQLVNAFNLLLGKRFEKIEVASPNAPITIVATDYQDTEYYIRLEKSEASIEHIRNTGVKIENIIYYSLAQLMISGCNVFHIIMCADGFIMWYLNDVTKEEINVTTEYTLIGAASALHIESLKDMKYVMQASSKTDTVEGQYMYKLVK
jgi:hypothetical protein